ncbi:MAG: hypothetical protein NTZ21_17230 [Actinobacteria bacterium]|nr:hypothetical protein [Actinomycetota bacterium]
MSYQQFPPADGAGGGMNPLGQAPLVLQPAAPFTPPPKGGRRAGLIGVGALLLAAGVVAGVVLFLASSSNYDEGVRNLARAPIGCTTSLEFDEAGTYTIYIETKGQIGELRGDCPNADRDYEFRGDDLPDVDIVLLDDNGDEVDLDRDESKDYDAAGFVGRSVASVEIPEAGDYEITATSDEDEIAVAVGRNPKETAGSMKTMGIGALALGVLIGGLCVVLGMRRKPVSGGGAMPPAPGSFGSYGSPVPPVPPVPYGSPPFGGAPAPGQVPVTAPPYQPPAYQPPPPPAPPAPTVPLPSTPPTPPAQTAQPAQPAQPAPPVPPAGGPSWPAPPTA